MIRLYEKYKPKPDAAAIITTANDIVDDYRNQGYVLTLRQLYYRFIAEDLFPDAWTVEVFDPKRGGTVRTKNVQQNYDKLGEIVGKARMGGLMDWTAIEDRTREVDAVPHWNDPTDILESCERSFRLDKWAGQPYRVECWVEKDALEGVVKRAAHALDVAVFSSRGYASLSSMWEAAQRLRKYAEAGQRPVILHMSDHDPSGVDMTDDVYKRLNRFLKVDYFHECVLPVVQSLHDRGEKTAADRRVEMITEAIQKDCGADEVEVRRIALTMDQVVEYDPPPSPAKQTDARYKKYVEQHGTEDSWELDALTPQVLDALIRSEIEKLLDPEKYGVLLAAETVHRADLDKAAYHWNNGLAKPLAKLCCRPKPEDALEKFKAERRKGGKRNPVVAELAEAIERLDKKMPSLKLRAQLAKQRQPKHGKGKKRKHK